MLSMPCQATDSSDPATRRWKTTRRKRRTSSTSRTTSTNLDNDDEVGFDAPLPEALARSVYADFELATEQC